MVGASKILTVSYGTFSCTLEGFDDPFSTMRSIAEYFRDLAADDRYFGAEPPTPDAEMLHKIAEREVQRRVEAKVSDSGVVLRQVEAQSETSELQAAPEVEPTVATEPEAETPYEPSLDEDTAPVAEAPTEAPTFAPVDEAPVDPIETAPLPPEPAGESVADKLSRIRAAVASGAGAAAAVGVAAATNDGDDDTGEDITAEAVEEIAEDVAEAEDMAEDEVMVDSDADDISSAFADVTDQADEPVEDPVAEELPVYDDVPTDMLAEEFPEPASDEVDEDDAFEAAADALSTDADASPDVADEADEDLDEEAASALEDVLTSEDALDDVVEDDLDDEAFEEAIDAPTAMEKVVPLVADEDVAVATEDAETAEMMAELAEDSAPEAEETALDDGYDAPVADLDDPIRLEEAAPLMDEAEDSLEDDEEVEEPTLSEEDETELLNELAAIGSEDDEIDEDFEDDLGAFDDAEEDVASLDPPLQDEVAQAEPAVEEIPTEPVEKTEAIDNAIAGAMAAHSETAEDGDAAFDRILEETNSKMDDSEGSRRRSAIAHLKAAVAATKADRLLKRMRVKEEAEQEEQSQYRDDLAQVVRPRRPENEGGDASSERPKPLAEAGSPLMLVSEQRVGEDGEDDDAPAPTVNVLPRRVTTKIEDFTPEDDEDDGENLFEPDESFAEFAEKMGATELPDLLEAAAAYSAFVEGQKHFSRPQLMKRVANFEANETFTREAGLRSFGQLLRQGKIQKLKRGQFTIREDTRFRPEARIAGE